MIYGRCDQARARCAEGMADGDRTAIRIDVGGIVRQTMIARHRQALRSEGFVEFDDVNLRESEAGLSQHS